MLYLPILPIIVINKQINSNIKSFFIIIWITTMINYHFINITQTFWVVLHHILFTNFNLYIYYLSFFSFIIIFYKRFYKLTIILIIIQSIFLLYAGLKWSILNFTISNFWTLNDAAENLLLLHIILFIMLYHIYWKKTQQLTKYLFKFLLLWHVFLSINFLRQQPVIHITTLWQPAIILLIIGSFIWSTKNLIKQKIYIPHYKSYLTVRWNLMVFCYVFCAIPWIIFIFSNAKAYSTPLINNSLIYLFIVLNMTTIPKYKTIIFTLLIIGLNLQHMLFFLCFIFITRTHILKLIHILCFFTLIIIFFLNQTCHLYSYISSQNLYSFLTTIILFLGVRRIRITTLLPT